MYKVRALVLWFSGFHPGEGGPSWPGTAPGQAVEFVGVLWTAGGTLQEGQKLAVSRDAQGEAGAAGVGGPIGGAVGPGLQEGGQVFSALLSKHLDVVFTAAPAKAPEVPSRPGMPLLFQLLQPL